MRRNFTSYITILASAMFAVFVIVGLVTTVSGDTCSTHKLTNGKAGIGCFDESCCASHSVIAGLCPGPNSIKCCFSTNTCGTGGSGKYDCYGRLMDLHPTGASSRTASQDSLRVTGVAASRDLVDNDIGALNKYKSCFVEAGNENCIDPAIVAAIASRESRVGKALKDGWGDCRPGKKCRGYGIMQCDIYTGLGSRCTTYPWQSCDNIKMMVRDILLTKIRSIEKKFPGWPKAHQMQGGVSAYNAGAGNVATFARMDIGSTGNDYSNDVIARAQWLKTHHGWP